MVRRWSEGMVVGRWVEGSRMLGRWSEGKVARRWWEDSVVGRWSEGGRKAVGRLSEVMLWSNVCFF